MTTFKFSAVLYGLLLLASSAFAKLEVPMGAQEVFAMGYETAERLAMVRATMTTLSAPSALMVDCNVARSGKCSVKASIEKSTASILAGAYRAESDTMQLLKTCYSPGDILLYRFSLKLPANWEIQPRSSIDIVWQFKRFNGPPDMFMAVKGNSLVLRIGANAQVTVVEPLPLGTWLDIDLKVHWSTRKDGQAEGTVRVPDTNLSQSFQYDGPTALDNKPQAAYLKWGLYKPGKTDGSMQFQPRSVWYDEIYVYKLN